MSSLDADAQDSVVQNADVQDAEVQDADVQDAVVFNNVRFSYDGARLALDDVSLLIEPKSFVCILGGNGSGKSTLAKHINALLRPDSGEVCVLGMDTSDGSNLLSIRSSAGMVFQNPDDQIVATLVEDDVAFGPENLGIAEGELRGRVMSALRKVGLQSFERRETRALSGGQKQRVAIAGVLVMCPKIIVLDEASAMLDPRGRRELISTCRKLNASGLTVIMITHFMEEAIHADRVIVLDDGKISMDGTPDEILTSAGELEWLSLEMPFAVRMSARLEKLGVPVGMHLDVDGLASELHAMIDGVSVPSFACLEAGGKHAEDNLPACATACSSPKMASDSSSHASASLLEFDHVSYAYVPKSKGRETKVDLAKEKGKWGSRDDFYWALDDVAFSLKEGEFVGIAGHTGSGKSTLIQLANGLLKPTLGSVFLKGAKLSTKREVAEARREIGIVFQYPERQLFAQTVFDDVAFGPRNLGLSDAEVESSVHEALASVGLDASDIGSKSPFALSGGQQRRVAVAGVLAMKPRILILDEPTVGLDPKARRSFLALIERLHSEGATIMLVTHDMDAIARLCSRVIVLDRGKIVMDGPPINVLEDEKELERVGLATPDVLKLSHVLNLPCADYTLNDEELAQAIAALCRGEVR